MQMAKNINPGVFHEVVLDIRYAKKRHFTHTFSQNTSKDTFVPVLR